MKTLRQRLSNSLLEALFGDWEFETLWCEKCSKQTCERCNIYEEESIADCPRKRDFKEIIELVNELAGIAILATKDDRDD